MSTAVNNRRKGGRSGRKKSDSSNTSSITTTTTRYTCDSCRFRKTRCDRKHRLAQGRLSCSFCLSMGLECRITPFAQEKDTMPRIGKRLKMLMQSNEEKEEHSISSERQYSNQMNRNLQNITSSEISDEPSSMSLSSPPKALNSVTQIPDQEDEEDKENETSSTVIGSIDLNATPAIKPFLGVKGLDRIKLDKCIEAFLQTIGICTPLSESADLVWSRYRYFVDLACGTSRSAYTRIEPASELLVLAIAFRGCGNTNLADKHELSKALRERFALQANDGQTLYNAGLDGIEAIKLISERTMKIFQSPTKDNMTSSLYLDILGRDCTVDLAMTSSLNTPTSKVEEQSQKWKRSRLLFWGIFLHDAFRSVNERRMHRIHDDDIGWPIPIIEPGIVTTFPDYQKAWYTLALIARSISRDLLSPRAKRDGVTRTTQNNFVQKLQTWFEELESPLRSQWDNDDVLQQKSLDNGNSSVELISRRSSLLATWLGLFLQVWACSPARMTQYQTLEDDELEKSMLQAFPRMASLARSCQKHNIVDYAPNELRNFSAAWCVWYAFYIRRATGWNINIGAQEIDHMNQGCHALLDCVRSAQSSDDSKELADKLSEMLYLSLTIAEKRLLRGMQGKMGGVEDLDSQSQLMLQNANNVRVPGFRSAWTFRPTWKHMLSQQQSMINTMNDDLLASINQAIEIPPAASDDFAIHTDMSYSGSSSKYTGYDSNDSNQNIGDENCFTPQDIQEFLVSCGIDFDSA